ncbi:NB-ARC domain-containing protein [Spongiactinospora sp. TRM90649]|uniref:NB-ARC domain-containing protein n=1 Tax=Spongiactinospora sp. TRM90649 TaxID=3031114 RepID=UPI0023FA1254|nr:NB-ARC domain-containing protein [Spongiactinospora sp. TRM90649]MDF5752797.1 NB-ARC domain-containing protein [Spongiactinospora sp. TRM90649]
MGHGGPGVDPGRVAEILVARDGAVPGRRGSGYRVTSGVVLTAAHVVRGVATVRVRFDADRQGEWTADGVVAWTDPRADVALITLETDREPVRPVRFARVPERDDELPGSAVGFPRFKLRADRGRLLDDGSPSQYRDSCHVRGRIPLLSNLREGTLELLVPPPAHDVEPGRSPWEGMSGALVWSQGRALGIVVEHHRSDGLGRLAVSRADRWYEGLDPAGSAALSGLVGLRPDTLDTLTASPRPDRPLTTSPPATGYVVPRPYPTARLLALLTAKGPRPPVGITALQGAGGFGKTTLAAEICAHPEIAETYPDGVLWVTVGERLAGAELATEINDLAEAISGERPSFTNPDRAGRHLTELIGHRRHLLVIDDVWRRSQLRPFLGGGPYCTRLITTRIRSVLPDESGVVTIDAMHSDEARDLLASHVPGLPPTWADRLGALTGRWPVLLGLVGRALRRAVREGVTPDQAAARIERRLRGAGPTALDVRRAEDRDQAVAATMEASLAVLPGDALERYLELAIFPDDVAVPLSVLAGYWAATSGLDEYESERLCEEFGDLALALYPVARDHQEDPALRLHDVLRAYLRARASRTRLAGMHAALLDGVPHAWWNLPAEPDYLWRHLAYHLLGAGRADELAQLTGDLRFVSAKLERLGPVAVVADLALVDQPLQADLLWAVGRDAHLLAPTRPAHALTDILLSRLGGVASLGPLVEAFGRTRRHSGLVTRWPLPDLPHPALQRVLTGHVGGVWGCAVAETTLVSCGADGTLRVWDIADGRCRAVLEGHSRKINACYVSPDAGWAATASDDMTVRVWDLGPAGGSRVLRGHTAGLQACTAPPTGTWLASGDAGGVMRLWDLDTGRERLVIDGHGGGIRSCAAAPDGTWVAVGGEDRVVRVWDAATGEPRAQLTGHGGGVWGCAVASDGTWLVSGDATGTVQVWDTATWEPRLTMRGHAAAIRGCSIAPDGTWLATASDDGTVRVWDAATGEAIAVFHGHRGGAMSCAAGPDGTWLATSDIEGALRMWSVADGPAEPRAPHTGGFQAFAAEPGGTWLVTGTTQGRLDIWDVREERVRLRLPGHPAGIWSCPVAPDGSWLASAGDDGTVRIWDTRTGALLGELPHPAGVWSCAIAPNGSFLATGDAGGVVRLWNRAPTPPSGGEPRAEPRLELRGHTAGVWGCPIGPDGTWLVTGGDDGTLRIWDVATGKQRALLRDSEGVWTVDLGPDGTLAASAGVDGAVRLWDLAVERVRTVLTGHVGGVWWCRFSPDGTWLASAGDDRTLRIWDVATGEQHAMLHGHQSEVWTCEPDPGGGWLASGDAAGVLRFWDTAGGAPRAVLLDGTGGVAACAAGDGWLATAGVDGAVRITDIATREVRAAYDIGGTVRSCAAGGGWLAAGGDGGDVWIWDLPSGRARARSRAHEGGVSGCAAAGARLATAGTDGAVRLWDAATGERHAETTPDGGPMRCCCAAGDAWVAAAGDSGRVYLWDATGRLSVLGEHPTTVRACAADPRGHWLATADAAGTVRLWDVAAGSGGAQARSRTLSGHQTAVTGCSADAAGRRLATADASGVIRVWDVPTGRCDTVMRVAESLRACCWSGADLCAGGSVGTYVFTYRPGTA